MSSFSLGSAMIRCSITGITTTEWHRSPWISCRHSSGSKRRRSTAVVPSSIPSARWAKPQVWNSGAAMCIGVFARSGIRSSRAIAASMPASLRGAPFGVPVVPEVRITTREWRSGGSRSGLGCDRMRASTVSSRSLPSVQARIRRSVSALSSSPENSSSWITAPGPSRSSTSTSCGPAKAVLSRRMSAPSLAVAMTASTK